jgi:hypothetical protein
MKLVTDHEISLAFPWVPQFRVILRDVCPKPFDGSHILVGSDYSGSHHNSDYLVYGFLLADADKSPEWPRLRAEVRERYLPDGRRMSFKRLNDSLRWRALSPFLDVANAFSGICAVVVVHKDLERMSTGQRTIDVWRGLHGTEGKWRGAAFETMARIVHLYCLFIAAVSKPFQHVTWITDQDEIVANDDRLTDVMALASKMIGLYVSYPLGEFAMNSTQVDGGDRSFEDFVAIPDLVAGSFAEIITVWSRQPGWRDDDEMCLEPDLLTKKSNLISAWFCHPSQSLKRCVILVDRFDETRFRVQRINVYR